MKNILWIGLIMSCITFAIVNAPTAPTATINPVVAWGCDGAANDLDLSTATAIAAGYNYSMVLKANGTVVAWGWYHTAYSGLLRAYVPALMQLRGMWALLLVVPDLDGE